MIYLPDTNACISLLWQKQPRLIARSAPNMGGAAASFSSSSSGGAQ
jgi:hypothetical protein